MWSASKPWLDRLPSICQVCGCWPSHAVCAACVQRFAPPRWRCPVCAAPDAPDGMACGSCLAQTGAPAVSRCVAAVDYAYPWDELVARFKFRDQPGWAHWLAHLIAQNPVARELLVTCDLTVPIPITPHRLGERGYNQAWELVKALHRRSAPPTEPAATLADALVRLGETPDQHSLGREQRLKNLRGAFAANPGHLARLAGAHVLLVDDVATTGATLHTAALALKQAGAAAVSALVFARTPPR